MGKAAIYRMMMFYGGESIPDGVIMKTNTREAVVLRRRDGTLAELATLPHGGAEENRRWGQARDMAGFLRKNGRVERYPVFALFNIAAGVLPFLAPLPAMPALLEGPLRAAVLAALLLLFSLTTPVRGLWRYHGAEHKAVNCVLQGLPLTLENARRQSTYCRACGHSALAVEWLLAAFAVPFVRPDGVLTATALRLALLCAARRIAKWAMAWERGREKPVRWLLAPGKLLQRITAGEPEDAELEVALRAAELALGLRKKNAPRGGGYRVVRRSKGGSAKWKIT